MARNSDALALFSGGLDSILAARLLENQGLNVLCVHFYSPFFGSPKKIPAWRETYGLDIIGQDVSQPFVKMLANGAPHGSGKNLNPCVDCKIVLLELARELMPRTGAKFLATGEVLGQRPMSQRNETLNVIAKASGAAPFLLRPLSALRLAPTPMEESGLVKREKLLAICGRGRNDQLRLAEAFKIGDIPTPAGGCRLTERENCRRYWPLLKIWRQTEKKPPLTELAEDFRIANLGRMLLNAVDNRYWLVIGKNESDNKKIGEAAGPNDILCRLDIPGPTALLRNGAFWPQALIKETAEILASYSRQAKEKGMARATIRGGEKICEIEAKPLRREAYWNLPAWETARDEIRAERRKNAGAA